MFIATQLLISFISTTSPTYTTLPDACDQINSRSNQPRLCEAHQEGAPVWDGDVCCDQKNCFAPDAAGCESDEVRYHCDYGEEVGRGVVDCYYEVADYCDVYQCDPWGTGLTIGMPPQAGFLCCQFGDCYPHTLGVNDCPYGDIYYCLAEFTNADGTVGCGDWD